MITTGNAEHRGCSRTTALAAVVLVLAFGAAGCGRDEATSSETAPEVFASISGVGGAANAPYAAGADLNADGSAELLLIPSQAAAEAFDAGEGVGGRRL